MDERIDDMINYLQRLKSAEFGTESDYLESDQQLRDDFMKLGIQMAVGAEVSGIVLLSFVRDFYDQLTT